MEVKQPLNITEFADVSGVGEAKLEKYADIFLKEIADHVEASKPKGLTHELTYNLYKEGLSPAEIAKKRKLTEDTIYSHLMKIYKQGDDLDIHQFITTEELAKIKKAKKDLPKDEGLKVYFDYLEGKAPYWKLKMGLYLLEE